MAEICSLARSIVFRARRADRVKLGKFRWSPHLALSVRIAALLGAFAEAAAFGQADLDRLSLARAVMLRKCEGRRGNSKLGELIDLFIATPLVTVQLAAALLAVSPQVVEAMLKELGGSLPGQLTGRKRYRAWGSCDPGREAI